MECTQRLECTQNLYESTSERICPEQIGFLGICGVKHPVKKGPNKIGRDPQTCSIVLNLNSISRQHAVINVLNQREFMLMDLDSANKTKLMDKTLPAYIPHPLTNGDMVQFGDVFGVFRLLDEDNDLPMTQAIDLPETPVATRQISRFNHVPVTTIPESPDVSDREESFIAPSQSKGEKCFKNANSSHFVKPSTKIIAIQPVGTNKIDNIYWNSSKKSLSLNSSLNSSTLSDKANNRESNDASIFDMETQPPTTADANDSVDSIYTANTQVPLSIHTANTQVPPSIHTANTQVPLSIHTANTQVSPSIHTANTQFPLSIHTADTQVATASSLIHTADTQDPTNYPNIHSADTQIPPASPSIHSLNTQLPISTQHLPEVCKIDDQKEMQFDLYTSNKQKDNIFEADTQPSGAHKENYSKDKSPVKSKITNQITKKLNISDEVILFDEIDCEQFEDDFASQPLLPQESLLNETHQSNSKNESTEEKFKRKKDVVIHSDSSTDCEDFDMLPTQKITKKKTTDDEDLTDCEDLFTDVPKEIRKPKNVDFENMLTQVIDDARLEDNEQSNEKNKLDTDNFEDLPTQVIIPEKNDQIIIENSNVPEINNINIEDLATQVIVAEDDVIITEKPKNTSFEDMPTQVISDLIENIPSAKEKPGQNETIQDFVSPFKIPLMSPIKLKRKDIKVITPKSKLGLNKSSPISIPDDDENYYSATQDILDDLCTQREENLEPNKNDDDEFLPSSVEDYEIGKRFPHLDNLSPRKKQQFANKSSGSSDGEDKVNSFVSKLSNQEIRDMVGVGPQVASLKRVPSDASDVELTPKKVRPIKFMDIDLPSSQEIKTSVSLYNKTVVTESSSESEVENDSEECTPILFRKKKKSKMDAKVDLTKVFEAESLPTRIITRVRKPTSKLQNSTDKNKLSSNILKPTYLTEQEDDIDKEIITENITRLKNKSEKCKHKDTSKEEVKKSERTSDEKENATSSEKKSTKNNTKTNKNTTKADKDVKRKVKPNDVSADISQPIEINKAKSKTQKLINKVESNLKNNITDNPIRLIASEVDKQNITVETSAISRSTRSTRNRRKADTKEISSVEKDDSQNENKGRSSRRQNNKKPTHIDLTEEVVEIRRSGRQRTSREKKEKVVEQVDKPSENMDKPKKPPVRRGRPPKEPKHEQSTVYSVSSDSGTDSPRNGKRSATGDLDPPSPKRTRSVVNPNNTSLRATPARLNKTHCVLFTAFPSEEVKTKLEKLGAVVVSDVSACSVVLTMAVKRTFKLLCAVGLGRPIVGPSWVQACADTNMIVDPWLYILKDEAAEKRFQFNLERTLTGKRNFLKGYNISATPNVMPSAPEMKLIVESSGGVWKEDGPQWICVSCSADKALWPALKRKGATVVSTEFILGGVLRQKADVAGNKIH